MPCAVKIVNRQAVKRSSSEKLNQILKGEAEVMNHLQKVTEQHENVTKVIETYKDPFHYYFVMELVTGGTLFDFYNGWKEMSVQKVESVTKSIVS